MLQRKLSVQSIMFFVGDRRAGAVKPLALIRKVWNGARRPVPAAKAERRLSVQSGDPRGDAGQRARHAEGGPSADADRTGEADPQRSITRGALLGADRRRIYGHPPADETEQAREHWQHAI